MTAPLWTSADIAMATKGDALRAFSCDGISIDTRNLKRGDLFVALSAARDGHDFVATALQNGAAGAIVSRIPEGVSQDAPLVVVQDVQQALEALARAARARMRGKVVAITGSVGKTTSKEMLRLICAHQGRTHASVASYNNHWGVPLTLARMPKDSAFAVIEIGMNHPGEIAPLAQMVAPDVALITTVSAAHLEAFNTIEDIADEKATIFTGLKTTGSAVFHADLPFQARIKAKAEMHATAVIDFGHAHTASARMLDIRQGAQVQHCNINIIETPYSYDIHAQGAHFAMNALGVLSAAQAMGLNMVQACTDLASWRPEAGRGAIFAVNLAQGGRITVIDDAYNANPTSMAAALEILAQTQPDQGGRRIAILGDMKELGQDERALHRDLAALPPMQKTDVLHAVGPLMTACYNAMPLQKQGIACETAAEILPRLPDLIKPGDVVLLKGSNSVGLAQIVDQLRQLSQTQPQMSKEKM